METIRVLVVDDSVFMRRWIERLAEEDSTIVIVGSAADGCQAVRLVKELRPDVVTMDVDMPLMSGLEALDIIMEEFPTRLIMMSSITPEGADAAVKALLRGAVDFALKPDGDPNQLLKMRSEIICKIKSAFRTPLSALISARRRSERPVFRTSDPLITEQAAFTQIVAIGTSTGGPKALETVVSRLPPDFPYPVVVAQHMPPKFTASLAASLNKIGTISVVEASHGQALQKATAYIAPGGYHMTVQPAGNEYRIVLHQGLAINGHLPSVDSLFHSVSELDKLKRHFVLMTGMGSDGAKGMAYAKHRGAASTIAEARETCVVYGMPRMAVSLNCVDHELPLTLIAAKIRRLTGC